MASITSATSGPSNATGTWTGGVVPGTTFAGTRTTTGAAVSIGATSIPIASAAQAVTAGKWLRVSGDSNYYRVATGVAGGSAGTIVLDSNTPLLVAIPAIATTLSVDMVDDQVTIAHPGTNALNTTAQFLTDTAGYSTGATSVVLTTGTGTIAAGECVQFGSDPAYYKVATGTSGAGTITIDAPGLTTAIPAAATSCTNRGHVVELVAPHVWGNDVSSLTAASNGIVVLGTLKGSRTTSHSLVCRGTLFRGSGGTIDLGVPGVDPIPDGVTSTILLNDSATLAAGKHGCANTAAVDTTFKVAGAVRTRNTRLSSGTSAGATSITVDASDGWAAGDRLVIGSADSNPAGAQVVTISGGSSPTWTVGAITNARLAGCEIGHLSSNVTLKSLAPSTPGFVAEIPLNVSLRSSCLISDVRFADLGSNSAWASLVAASPNYVASLNIAGASATKTVITRAAFESTTNAVAQALSFGPATLQRHQATDIAVYLFLLSGATGVRLHSAAGTDTDGRIYRADVGVLSSSSDGSATCAFAGYICANSALQYGPALALTINDTTIKANTQLVIAGSGALTLNNCSISGTSGAKLGVASNVGHSGTTTINGGTIGSTFLTTSITTSNIPSLAQKYVLTTVNGDTADNRVINYYQTTITDTTTRRRGTYAVKIQPKVASTAITYTFTLPAVSGEAQVIKGSLRFDSTYGTATPPSIALSGQGVTESYTCTATADTWFDFEFDFTPTSTGDITATVTVQSTSTSGFAWLDGVWHYPMTQTVRHFGYLWQNKAAQDVDSSITVSEATALAYPVVVDHGTNTITVTGDATARQVYEACMADLCQTANIGEAKHISTVDDGDTFTTTYEVVPQSGVTITGNYTDALGVHVALTATLPIAGCRIQLYDVTGAQELSNQVVSGTSFVFPILYDVYSAGHVLRLRVAYQSGTSAKLPQEVFATLGSSGASFTVPDEADTVYATNAIDGSTCTEFTASYPDLHIDVSDGDGTTSVQRIYAWSVWANTQADGIRLMFMAVTAQDELNYVIDQSVVDAHFDNVTASPVIITGGYIKRADGTTVIASTSGSIQMDPGRAYIATGTVPTAAQNASAVRTELTTELGRLDVAVSTRLATAGYTAPPTAAENADKVLGRNLAGGSDGGRTVQDALRASRNKTAISGSTLTVYAEDDTTPAWEATVTTAERDALSGIDPA